MLQAFDNLIHEVGPLAFLMLGLAAALEYVVPPFPGDSVVLLGGVYAVRGQQPYWLVFTAVMVGSVLGALINFSVGQALGKVAGRDPSRQKARGISLRALHEAEARMRRYGDWLLVGNRFIPGIRGLLFVAAGMSGVPRRRAMVLGAISAAAHTGALLALGIALGGNAERIGALVERWQRASLALVAVAGLGLLVRILSRRRKNDVAAP